MYRTFEIMGLCLLALMGLSCSSNQNIKESYSMEPFGDRLRVFYGETGDPCESASRPENCERLLSEELNRIQTSISELTQEPIWFVRVPLTSSQRSRSQLWVYLAPDIANTRFRSGLAYTIRRLNSSKGPSVSSPWRYVQVSLPEEVFDSTLETPEVYDLPFPYPPRDRISSEKKRDLLSEEDLVSLMDYVRKPEVYLELGEYKKVSKKHLPGQEVRSRTRSRKPWREHLAEIIVMRPVVGIREDGDEITVTLGFVHNGLFARCCEVKVRVTEQGYQYITFGTFVS
jgi:hypothetical protein